jgi:hypothetical protein
MFLKAVIESGQNEVPALPFLFTSRKEHLKWFIIDWYKADAAESAAASIDFKKKKLNYHVKVVFELKK